MKMRVEPWIMLRVASVITFLYFAGHTLGIPWTPAVGPQEVTLLESMKSHHFDAMGFSRTYWNFYYGFGLVISGYLPCRPWCYGNLRRVRRPIRFAFARSSRLSLSLSW
jgi:hypothetical protein